jgi:hypothetical protein
MHFCQDEALVLGMTLGTAGTIWIWVKAEVYAVVAYFRQTETFADESLVPPELEEECVSLR